MHRATFPLLESIDSPRQLRELDPSKLILLADELRHFIIHSLSQTGGHFSSNLGTVELTIALHYVFNTPDDRLVWDVGHQSYPHKILTGRREAMPSIRQYKGISGFPKRSESPYDTFGVGHSSTSISAALGMALAARQQNIERHCIAVIGDGAMTAGMAFEALSHASDTHANVLVILNDNEMSISPNVGALQKYLARILASHFYNSMREGSKELFKSTPKMQALARRTEEHMKGMVIPGTLFEELGFNYIGPIDGHDVNLLVETLGNLKDRKEPQLLHVVTQKGKGYSPAEADPCVYHAVGSFDKCTGELAKKPASSQTYTQVFSDWLCDMAAADDRLVGITPAMREGSGLVAFSEAYPERYFDVGIAEQHSVTVAAGMACDGLKPIVAIYSTFLQRAYDQLIHDVAIQNLPVLFAIDRAGLVGADGATHAGSFDISFLRCIPNMVIMVPVDGDECRKMLSTGFQHDSPVAVRYPRGSSFMSASEHDLSTLEIGKGCAVRQGQHIAILVFGPILNVALEVAEAINATVINMRFVKPLDVTLLLTVANNHDLLVTLEDNAIMGGAGSAVNEALHAQHIQKPVLNLGLPDQFQGHGTQAELLSEAGLDSKGVLASIEHYQANDV